MKYMLIFLTTLLQSQLVAMHTANSASKTLKKPMPKSRSIISLPVSKNRWIHPQCRSELPRQHCDTMRGIAVDIHVDLCRVDPLRMGRSSGVQTEGRQD